MWFLSLLFVYGFICINAKFTYDVKYIKQPVDHFDFTKNATFNMRYLYNDTHIKNNNTYPILFYTGNEGDIELFAQNTGFVWDLAEKLSACVVFAEHRYYGQSLPFGDATFNKTSNLGFLSVEQTLEDYVQLITSLNVKGSHAVIAFGGSYGGMLAAWLRMKFPNIVDGALASSAPIWQFTGLTPCDIFDKITTSVFKTVGSVNCSDNIQKSWKMFRNISSAEHGMSYLSTKLQFCNPITKSEELDKFLDYLEDVYGTLAMVNYPYANQFLTPLPAYPVSEFCYRLKDKYSNDTQLLNAFVEALSVYTNYTGKLKCLDFTSAYNVQLDDRVWSMQTCNQMVMPFCSHDTMFRKKEWNFATFADNCVKKFGIRPKENDIIWRYGGKNLRSTSNIIFSNGLLDPWSGGGVLQSTNDKIYILIIPEGAHHLDLRSADPSDPASVKEARLKEGEIIRHWIKEKDNQ